MDGDRTSRFTMKRMELLEPAPNRYEVRDTGQPGLALRVYPTGHKAYCVLKGIGRQGRRIKVGDFTVITLEDIRHRAKNPLGNWPVVSIRSKPAAKPAPEPSVCARPWRIRCYTHSE